MSTPAPTPKELFRFTGSSASAYSRRVGGVTTSIAAYALTLLPPLSPNAKILDNACGPGVLISTLLAQYPGARVDAVDNSADMIAVVGEMLKAEGWGDRVEAAVMDGCGLGFEEGMFDISVTNFGIALFPDAVKGAREIFRTLKAGGTAVVTSWKCVGWLPLLHEVQKAVRPTGKELFSMGGMAEWERKEKVVAVLVKGGFEEGNVRVEERESVAWADGGVEGMVGAMEENLGPMTKGWEETEKKEVPNALTKILTEQKERFLADEAGGRLGLKGFTAWIAIAKK